jgi:hypothetical protein
MPGRRRAAVPVVIRCHRTSLARRVGWFLSDLWDFLKSPRFRA